MDWASFSPQMWVELVQAAHAERVAPVFYWQLKEGGWLESAPPETRQKLSKSYYASTAYNTLLFHELDRLLARYVEERLPVILLKGATLANILYPEPGLRPMSDLDLLVERNRLDDAVRLAQALGYHLVKAEYLGVADWLDQAANHHTHLRGGPQEQVTLELHWTLVAGDADWRSPPDEWFWGQRQPSSQRSHQASGLVFELAPIAGLLYLAAHLTMQHADHHLPLLWVYDLHLLVSRLGQTLDWEALLEQAGELGWSPGLFQALAYSHECFATLLPSGFLERLASQPDGRSKQAITSRSHPTGNRLVDTLRAIESMQRGKRLRLLWALLFPHPGYMRWRYRPRPDWLWLVYYPYRWWDIAREAGRYLGSKGKTK